MARPYLGRDGRPLRSRVGAGLAPALATKSGGSVPALATQGYLPEVIDELV